MAKLLLIKNNKQYIPEINYINDVIAIRESSHKFNENEINKFNVLEIPGTMKQAEDAKNVVLPEVAQAYWDGEWVKITELTLKKDIKNEIVTIWKDGSNYKRYENPPKYFSRYESSKFEENISASGNDTLIAITDRNP